MKITKKLFALIVVISLMLMLLPVMVSANGVYLIYSLDDWNDYVVANCADGTAQYKLMADLVGANAITFVTGDVNTRFAGHFDGNGHTVELDIEENNVRQVGLFAEIELTGIVENVRLVGRIESTLTITTEFRSSDRDAVGSFSGTNYGEITGCISDVALTSFGVRSTGGIAGTNMRTITDCGYTGDIVADYGRVGGIAGMNSGGYYPTLDDSVYECFSTGSITVSGRAYAVGGIIGNNHKAISHCFSSATIVSTVEPLDNTVDAAILMGGICGGGYNDTMTGQYIQPGKISDSYFCGSIKGGDKSAIGGIFGGAILRLIRCYAIADLSGGDNSYVGGLVTRFDFSYYQSSTSTKLVSDSYSVCVIEGGEGSVLGGVAALASVYTSSDRININDYYWNTELFDGKAIGAGGGISALFPSSEHGITPLKTHQMLGTEAPTNMPELDFPTDWVTKPSDARYNYYPQLAVFANSDNAFVREASANSVRIAKTGERTPVIIKNPVASNLEAGRTLSSSILSKGEADVSGSFVWTDGTERMDSVGMFTRSVTFMPDDADYSAVEFDIDVTVYKPQAGYVGGGSGGTQTPKPTPTTIPARPSVELKPDAKNIRYIKGYSGNTFKPDMPITRYEMLEALALILDIKNAADADAPSDVREEYKETVALFVGSGIIEGDENGMFNGDKGLTRAEFVKVMSVVLKLDTSAKELRVFSDTESHWADSYINAFLALGYIKGYGDGTFKPDLHITRAEFVAVVNRIIGVRGGSAVERFKDLTGAHWAFDDIMAVCI